MRPATRHVIGRFLAVPVLLLIWEIAARLIDSPALPGPASAIAEFMRLVPTLLPHAGISAYRVLAALIIGTALALPIGLYIGRSPRLDAIAAPLTFLTYPIPKVVFLPVLMVLMGIGDASKIALIAVIVFFQILITARDAARAIPEGVITSVRSLGGTPLQIARHVVLPATLPEVFTALRISIGTAIAVLFLSESFAGSTGLGAYISDMWGIVNYRAMFAGIIAMALLGAVLYEAIDLLENRLTRWRATAR